MVLPLVMASSNFKPPPVFKKEEMYGQSSKSMKSQQHLVNIPQNAGSNENYIHCSVNT
jgi:hypothetical protein